MNKKLYKLKIDDDFANIFPGRSQEDELTKQLLADGCRDDLITWNGTIIDGHSRYRICHENNIPFSYREMSFPSKERAKLWIVENQIARRNLTVFQRCMIVLPLEEAYKEEAEERRKNKISSYRKNGETVQNSAPSKKSRDSLAALAGTSHDTLSRIKFILENGNDELKEKLNNGKISIHKAFMSLQREPESIGGVEPFVHMETPVETHCEEFKRNPGDFFYVKDHACTAMKIMLKELKAALYQMRTEDFNRRDELLAILEDGYDQAKQLIMKETGK